MKRAISILLSVCLCVSLAFAAMGCAGADTLPSNPSDNFVFLVEVSINPNAWLYLDAGQNILSLECQNDDAEKVYNDLRSTVVGMPLNTGLRLMLDTCKQADCLTDDSTIAVNVVKAENMDTLPEVLNTVNQVSRDFLAASQLQAQVSISQFGEKLTEEYLDSIAPSVPDDSGNTDATTGTTAVPTTQPTTAPTTAPTTKPTEAPEPVLPELIDMDAEYIGEVEYRTIVVKKSNKLEVWSMNFLTEEDGTGSYGVHVYTYEKGAGNGFTPTLEYKGNTYYEAGGTGGGWGTYSVEDNSLVLTGDDDEALKMKLGMTADKDLVVVSVTDGNGFYKVGTILEAIEY